MTRKEFISKGVMRGYCTRAQGQDFCRIHPKDDYTEEDLERLYGYGNARDWSGTQECFGRYRYCHVTPEDMNCALAERQNIYRNHGDRICEPGEQLFPRRTEQTEGC